jgi:hypothetical protein
MKVNEEKARDIVFDDCETWELITKDIIGTSRWSTILRGVFKNEDKYYQVEWEEGATEMQASIPFECQVEVEFIEVEEVEKTVKVFQPISNTSEAK